MENRAHALLAGLFVILLGIAAAFAFWWFGNKQEQTRDYVVETRANVTGLNPQGQVRYRGIRVGRVQGIDLDRHDPALIHIRIRIRDDVPLTRGTTAKLGYQGITGIAYVQLEESGSDPTPLVSTEKAPAVIAMKPSLVDELADSGADVLRQVRQLVTNLNKLTDDDNRARMTATLDHLEAATRELQPTLASLRSAVSPENVAALQSTLKNTAAATQEAAGTLREAQQLAVRLQSVAERLDRGVEESAGSGFGVLSPRWDELAGQVATDVRQLNRLLKHLERNPQSLIFGAPPAAPGPGEAGFSASPAPAGGTAP
ncbi:phospholipid/cholesterol/gamma-HCH ABC transporter substrate-binding protein [Oryzomicrobium terrae]|uniref:Phospholipid/cholesterol/gamma-HCH ABC transporter substrate-binding protein n=1 Tax=Oryzomicrobium terrae TaxID=1735038 RepID=A0A5C1E9F5_9RHOO|nr:MlaD family protein [Oryzomicrobium terrae]QEL65315.1 phospholipid/cholesterol/gamma-HCH ABC transporter substrate-binding protein [Oryzomicrobium terrae]